jgi:thiol:disulfide interchange protein DsbD
MALPYLAASWVPAVARALPRPGAWMARLRQFMAFPMFATVVWLLWVLGQQTGIDGAAALLMLLVALALLVWTLQLQGRSRQVLGGLALAGLLWLGVSVGPGIVRPLDTPPSAGAVPGPGWEAWTPELQARLLAEGRPVFVDFTAAWCVTCQFNKRTTLADASLLSDMAKKNIALLRADWTRRDPAVTQALAGLGRNGVPVYAIYKNGQAPVVLSEVLSVEEVRAALAPL